MRARFGVLGAVVVGGLAACSDDAATQNPVTATSPVLSPPGMSLPDAGSSSVTPPTPAATTPAPGPTSTAPLPTENTPPPPAPPPITPDAFADGDVTVTIEVHTDQQRKTISPLIYGMNSPTTGGGNPLPESVLAGTTFVRRGGDRSNAYNWETNASNGAEKENWANDMYLANGLSAPNAPGELDREMIAADLAGGRGSMVPFVLNGYVAGPPASNIPFTQSGWDIDKYFRKVELVKPTAFSPTPDLDDGVVYTDEHIEFLKAQFSGNIYAPGATQVMIGSDNEPDLWESNYPMVQRGSGDAVYVNGTKVGNRVTADEFTARYLAFAKRVKQVEPTAMIVGPDHFHFDGYTMWHTTDQSVYTDDGRWYMDDFLAQVKAASDQAGVQLLDTWDMHWYPQPMFGGTFTWKLDNSVSPLTDEEIDAILQGPRSYWDDTYMEHSWITDDHLHAPANILNRLMTRINAAWPGMPMGVTEYFPGGCSHVSSALATADTLGVFGKMGVHIAAMWPHTCDITFALAGFRLMRNADGNGLKFGDTSVQADDPERAESSVYAATKADNSVTVLVVNKTNATRSFGLRLFAPKLATVDVYRVDASHDAPALASQSELTKTNAYAYAAPARSASLLVFR